MKKVLLASTALVLTAGVAAAEFSTSGGGVVGFKYDGTDTMLHYELDFSISGSTETDGGVGFTASFDLDLDDGTTTNTINDAEIGIMFGGLSVYVGEIASATDKLMVTLPDVGFDGIGADDDTEAAHDKGTYNVLATYDFGMGTVGASFYVDDSTSTGIDDISIAAAFDFAGITVAVSYTDQETVNILGETGETLAVGVAGEAAGFGYNLFYHQFSGDGGADVSTIGLAGSFDIDSMTTVTAVVGLNEDVSSDNDFSVGIERSLGGGVAFAAGVGSINGETVADAGFTFDF